MSNIHQLKPGQPVRLADLPTTGRELHSDKGSAVAEYKGLRAEQGRET